MDRNTVAIYERHAGEYARSRPARHRDRAAALAVLALPGLPVLDMGCGPGTYLADLGPAVIGLDAAGAMLALAGQALPGVPLVQGDIERLPFHDGSAGGAWARNSYVHVAHDRLPLALARLHWALAVGAPACLSLVGEGACDKSSDDLPGRFFALWAPDTLARVVSGAGFDLDDVSVDGDTIWISARRAVTLPDTVGPGMRVLVCGLNPSEVAAAAGYGYAGHTNRFWAAAMAAGMVTKLRDPLHALEVDGVGMTDLVKRPTPSAATVTPAEYRDGFERVRSLAEWLHPEVLLFVGLSGWRAAVNRRATPGFQAERFGPEGVTPVAVYVMPSTSGLNARTTMAELVDHIRMACTPAGVRRRQPNPDIS